MRALKTGRRWSKANKWWDLVCCYTVLSPLSKKLTITDVNQKSSQANYHFSPKLRIFFLIHYLINTK